MTEQEKDLSRSDQSATAVTKLSPAPWVAKGTLLDSGVLDYCIEDANGEEIAALYLCDGGDEPVPFPADANAHLIAAAPDLLEALKSARDRLCDAFCPRVDGEFIAGHMVGCKRASEAIAKAEGRS